MMSPNRILILLGSAVFLLAVGLGSCLLSRSQHEKIGWKAEDYFTDPKVIELCDAIEDDDLAEIDRLIAQGVDVNARGKGNMTPLLWSFIADEKTFERMLIHGADPNVIVTDGFNTRGMVKPGYSVMAVAAQSRFPNHLKLALKHGADPNLVDPKTGETPLHRAIRKYRLQNVRWLIAAGADVNKRDGSDYTPLILAEGRNFYSATLALLEAGADYTALQHGHNDLALQVASRMGGLAAFGGEPTDEQRKVVAFLEERGVDMDAVEEELIKRSAELKNVFPYQMPPIHARWRKRAEHRPWLAGVRAPVAGQNGQPENPPR